MPFGLGQCGGNTEKNQFGCATQKIKDPNCDDNDDQKCKKIKVSKVGLMKDAKTKNFKRMLSNIVQGQYAVQANGFNPKRKLPSICLHVGAPVTPTNWNPLQN